MPFQSSLAAPRLTTYLERLIGNIVPDGDETTVEQRIVDRALERVERCFSAIQRKYFADGDDVSFDHRNGDHLATFLYLAANTAWADHGDEVLATKLFAANKALHGLDLFYAVRMPEVFLLVHPVGSVIGNAEYQDELVIYQNCTVGSDGQAYPRFGRGVILFARSAVIGGCTIGDNVVLAANSFLVNVDVPSDSVVVGQFPGHQILPNRTTVHERIFAP
jgi:serine O-acetyltransferase